MINGFSRRNLAKHRARVRFSTDGDPSATYRCKIDGGDLVIVSYVAELMKFN